MNPFKQLISDIRKYIQRKTHYILVDGRDGTITLGKKVFEAMGGNDMRSSVMMIKIGDKYAFTNELIFDMIDEGCPSFEVQYNTKYKTVGFNPSTPTLATILYDYGMPHDAVCRLSVQIEDMFNVKYFIICPPTEKQLNELDQSW